MVPAYWGRCAIFDDRKTTPHFIGLVGNHSQFIVDLGGNGVKLSPSMLRKEKPGFVWYQVLICII